MRNYLLVLIMLFLIVPVASAQDENADVPVATVIAYRLNVRAEPTTNSPVLRVAEYGQSFVILGRTEGADWLQIQLTADTAGWVAARYTEETIGAATPIIAVDLSNNVIQVTQDVNVRSGPGELFVRINGLVEGTTVTVIGRSGDNTWAQIQQPNGATGWIFDGALPSNFDLTPLPVPESALIAALLQGAPWRTVNRVGVRMGPENYYPLIEYLEAGTDVQVIGRDTLSQWVKIRYPISNGWIPATAFPEGTNIGLLPVSLRLDP